MAKLMAHGSKLLRAFSAIGMPEHQALDRSAAPGWNWGVSRRGLRESHRHDRGMATSSTIHETRRSVCDLWEPAIRYLRANPFNGIKVPLGEAPWSTWVLVGPFVAITLGIGLWTGQLDPGVASWWQFAVLPVVLIVFPARVRIPAIGVAASPDTYPLGNRCGLESLPWRRLLGLTAMRLL